MPLRMFPTMFDYSPEDFAKFREAFKVSAEEVVELFDIYHGIASKSKLTSTVDCKSFYDLFMEIGYSTSRRLRADKTKFTTQAYDMDSPDYIA